MENNLKWHWEADKRICNHCGGEVLLFEEGEICSVCNLSNDNKDVEGND